MSNVKILSDKGLSNDKSRLIIRLLMVPIKLKQK